MLQEIIIGLLTFVLSAYFTIVFKLKPIIENYVREKEKEFFKEIGSTIKVDKNLFEEWLDKYYKINAPMENLKIFHRWAIILIPLLFISLIIDTFTDKIPKELNGMIMLFALMTSMVIIFFFMYFSYLVNWYMEESKD